MGRVTFLGACGTLTGSSTLLAWGTTRLLVDCGMFQGPEEVEQRNFQPFPYRHGLRQTSLLRLTAVRNRERPEDRRLFVEEQPGRLDEVLPEQDELRVLEEVVDQIVY